MTWGNAGWLQKNGWYRNKASVAAVPLSLDGGTGATKTANASLADVPLPAFSTSGPDRIVCIAQTGNGGSFVVPTGGGLTFALIPGESPVTGGSSQCAVYWAFAPTQLTNVVFTIHQGSAAYFTGLVFAVIGGKTSGNPFDVNSPSMDSTGSNALITTAVTETFAFGVGINPGAAPINSFIEMNPTASGTYVTLNYRIVSGSTLGGVNWDGTAMAGSIGAALVQGP